VSALAFTCTFVRVNLSVVGEREGLGISTPYGMGDRVAVTEGVGEGIVLLLKVLEEWRSSLVAFWVEDWDANIPNAKPFKITTIVTKMIKAKQFLLISFIHRIILFTPTVY
jgi:hypothetical protein